MPKLNENKAPTFPKWLVSKLIDKDYLEEFFGDLQEMHEHRIPQIGRFRATVMYWIDALHLMIGFSSVKIFKTQNNNPMMIKNMFKIAWRNAMKQKQFTILNMLGLTIGITTCFIIGLYVHDELTYDTFHTKGDRIYRINQPMIWNDWNTQFASTGPNVAIALREDAPEFEEVTRLLTLGSRTARKQSDQNQKTLFKEDRVFVAEENFFDVFSYEFLQGSAENSLLEPMCVVITERTAERYFGYEEALGKVIEVKSRDGSWKTYTVKGVIANPPYKSHLRFDMLMSFSSHKKFIQPNEWKWIWTTFSTYGLVKEGTDIQALTDKIQSIPPKWAAPTTQRIFNQTFEEYTAGRKWRLYLQPLRTIYQDSNPAHHRFGPTGDPQYVKIFGAIGVLVLLLSSINFMNLSTAKSSNRAKEVGIRKVLGSKRSALVKQFIFESILFVAVSTACALLLVHLSLDNFNTITLKQITLTLFLVDPIFLVIVIVFISLLGVMAGSYPAFYLSSFRPIETLKGKVRAGFSGKGIRNGLVIFQFTISIALIICTFFVQKQLAYTSSLDLGLAKENVLQIANIEELGLNDEVLKTKLATNPAFIQLGTSYAIPPNIWEGERYKMSTQGSPVDLNNFRADQDYIDLLGLEFIAGRNFDKTRVNDKYGVVLNEAAAKVLGLGSKETFDADSPIGKKVICAFDDEEELTVLGVVKDFNFHSVRHKIDPLAIIHYEDERIWNYGRGREYLSMRLNPEVVKNSNELQLLIENVKHEIAQMDESIIFEYSFLDQEFEDAFRSEQTMSGILNTFTLMALIIACLGLFGLAAFSAEQRTKELSIRKVLGAKVSELVFLFSSEFTKLIYISVLIAVPMAYYLVDYWLEDFAYRTPIHLWVFVVAALSAITVAILTISYQSLKAAYKNPAETLKNE